jgi:hypothetical protein
MTALIAFLGLQYGSALRVPFLNDDYLFLNSVAASSPLSLLAPNTLVAHYYRPWSRELHYWVLQSLAGPNSAAFHLVNMSLWLVTMGLFFLVALRTAGARAALVATCGAALVSAWGTPILWAAGGQDLWMLAGGLTYLWCFILGRTGWAHAPLAISLLSKETAGVLPAIATAYVWTFERRSLRGSFRRTGSYWVMVVIWGVLHPMFGGSWWGDSGSSAPQATLGPCAFAAIRSALAVLSLHIMPAPEHGFASVLWTALPGAIVLGSAVWWGLARRGRGPETAPGHRASIIRPAAWGVIWWAIGWLPGITTAADWQPYYGLLGLLGAWLAIGTVISRRREIAVAAIVAAALLRSASAQTPEARLGSEWHQRRLGRLTDQMRTDLVRLRPSLPPHSRVYFGDVPWGLGIITSHPSSPALRVWYGDSTVSGGFYSTYVPRLPSQSHGQDFFFLFEPPGGRLVEVVKGPELLDGRGPPTPRWELDHVNLAQLLFRSGDHHASLAEWRKLVTVFPDRVEYARAMAVTFQRAGNPDSATIWARRAAAMSSLTETAEARP